MSFTIILKEDNEKDTLYRLDKAYQQKAADHLSPAL
jgi:hypothetical protein